MSKPSSSPLDLKRQLMTLRACLAGLLLAACATTLAAQLPGTMFGLVTDANEEPIAGATITLTDPVSPEFRQVETTDDKGKYRIFIADATKKYTFTITKDGYRPMSLNGVRVSARQRTRRNWELTAADSAPQGALTGGAPATGGGANSLFNRGVTAMNAGDLDSAEQSFKEALEKNPDLHNANAALARVYLERESWKDALKTATLAKEAGIDPDSMNQILYQSYNALGEKKKAREILTAMQSADPSKATANMFNEAADLYNQGDSAGAKPKLEEVLALDADHPKANYILGMIYVAEQVNDKAKTHLEKFISLAPEDPDAALAKEMLSYLE